MIPYSLFKIKKGMRYGIFFLKVRTRLLPWPNVFICLFSESELSILLKSNMFKNANGG